MQLRRRAAQRQAQNAAQQESGDKTAFMQLERTEAIQPRSFPALTH